MIQSGCFPGEDNMDRKELQQLVNDRLKGYPL